MKVELAGSVALAVIERLIAHEPETQVQTHVARWCAEAIGLHLTMLIKVASDANVKGCHSCALSLFRAMEDALDCLAAVSLVPGAAEKWSRGKLKASEAARLSERKLGLTVLPTGELAPDYRKDLRTYFNTFAHCSPYLTDWNVYPEFGSTEALEPCGTVTAQLKLNHEHKLLEQNAVRIAAYLAGHTLEFIGVIEKGYERFLGRSLKLKKELDNSKRGLEELLKRGLEPVYLEEMPPELKQPVLKHPSDPNLVMPLSFPSQEQREETGRDDSG